MLQGKHDAVGVRNFKMRYPALCHNYFLFHYWTIGTNFVKVLGAGAHNTPAGLFWLASLLSHFLKKMSTLKSAGTAILYSKPPFRGQLKIFHSADSSFGCWIPSVQLCSSGCAGVFGGGVLGFSSIHFANQTWPSWCQLSLKSARASCCQLIPHTMWCQNYRIILISRSAQWHEITHFF